MIDENCQKVNALNPAESVHFGDGRSSRLVWF